MEQVEKKNQEIGIHSAQWEITAFALSSRNVGHTSHSFLPGLHRPRASLDCEILHSMQWDLGFRLGICLLGNLGKLTELVWAPPSIKGGQEAQLRLLHRWLWGLSEMRYIKGLCFWKVWLRWEGVRPEGGNCTPRCLHEPSQQEKLQTCHGIDFPCRHYRSCCTRKCRKILGFHGNLCFHQFCLKHMAVLY